MTRSFEKKINYIDYISSELVKELKIVQKALNEEKHLFSNESRARFKRLRVELSKELVKVESIIYGK